MWGGREGFQSILNTQIKQGLLDHHMAAIFKMMAIAHKKEKNNTTAQFLIGTEPKLCEPIKHQYDYDPQTTTAFLKTCDLDKKC